MSYYLKFIIYFFLFFYSISIYSQKFPWGEIAKSEIDLKDVPFEKGAGAVILKNIGYLTITNDGYELEDYARIKILTVNGYDESQKKWLYNNELGENVDLIDAQTTNFVNGVQEITKIDQKDVFINKVGNNKIELAIAFPNIRVGSIIEYKILIKRPYNIYDAPWSFQNAIPTIYSVLQAKNKSISNYRIILNGALLTKKYDRKKGITMWELNNVPSYNMLNHIYNIEDYREKLMFQYNSAGRYYGNYFSENSWRGFKKIVRQDIEKNIEQIDFDPIANKIKNGSSKIETLRNCIQFLRDNYIWNNNVGVLSDEKFYQKLLATKTGNTADFNILLNGILRKKNIDAKLVINSFRSNGKMILSNPLFSRLQTLLNIVTVDNGDQLIIDAAVSNVKDINYLPLDYYNNIMIDIAAKDPFFIEVSPKLSEYVSQQFLEINENDAQLKVRDQLKGYFDFQNYENESFSSFIVTENEETEEQQLNDLKVKSKTFSFEYPKNSIYFIENPFLKTAKELMVEKDRNYPIELDFPFISTIQLKFTLLPNYTLITENYNEEIASFNQKLQYIQKCEIIDKEATITWSLLMNKTIFRTDEIEEYNQFINQFIKTFSKPLAIKKE